MNDFQKSLKKKMDDYAHEVYSATKKFPKDELYGIISQIRRSSLSVVLNYIEGYARKKILVRINFLETSYGSLQESKYLLDFSFKEKYLDKDYFDSLDKKAEEIAKMLWSEISSLVKNNC